MIVYMPCQNAINSQMCTHIMCTHMQAQVAAKDIASEQQNLAMQIRVLRKEYQDKAIAIRWANRRKARLLGSSATPVPSDEVTLLYCLLCVFSGNPIMNWVSPSSLELD